MTTYEKLLKEEIEEITKLHIESFNSEFEDLDRNDELTELQDKADFWQSLSNEIYIQDITVYDNKNDYISVLKSNYPDFNFTDFDLDIFESDIIHQVRHNISNYADQQQQVYENELAEELEQEEEVDHSPSP